MGWEWGQILQGRQQMPLLSDPEGSWAQKGEIRFVVRTTPTQRSLSHPNTHPHKNTAELQVICLMIEKTVCVRDGVHFSSCD